MKLHTVFITYNRLELTKQAIASYLETVSVPHTFMVVDNGSSDGTSEWVLRQNYDAILLDENHYPGYACNRGWEVAPEDATFLHRADNDFVFLDGWCERVQLLFQMKKIGQVGLRTDEEETFNTINTGGNCVIRRALWDKGLRWDERPWSEYVTGHSEDSLFSPAVRAMKYTWKRVREPCIVGIATGDMNDPYYQESYGARGITDPSYFGSNLGIASK